MREVAPGHAAACHFAGRKAFQSDRLDAHAIGVQMMRAVENEGPPLLEVRHLVKHFPVRRSLGDSLRRRPHLAVRAVDGVEFQRRQRPNPGARW